MEGTHEPIHLPKVVPRCLEQLAQTPPMCLLQERDIQALQVLREHGRELGVSVHGITQACNLASGLSDVVVILERPRKDGSHPPDQGFDGFVNACRTLKIVDELLRFASRGTRNIGTVTVVNAFSFQPVKEDIDADRRREEILARFLQAKRPRVIIHCSNSGYQSPSMRRFNFHDKSYRVRSEDIEIADGHSALVIPSFHPSQVVNIFEHRLELRVLLMYHFALAFRSLSDGATIPCCASRIRDLCFYQGERKEDKSSPSEWDLATCISDKLNKSYLHYGNEVVPLSKSGFADESLAETIDRESGASDSMNFWLTLLLTKPQKFDLFGIASVLHILRRSNNPIYSRFSSELLELKVKQDHWFCKAESTHVANVEERLSAVTFHDGLTISGIIDATRKACGSVSKIRDIVERGEYINLMGVEIRRHYTAVIRQNSLLTQYLASTQDIAISQTLRMEALSKRCWVTIETLHQKSELEEEHPPIEVILHLSRLLECLTKLRMELEAARE